MLTVALRGACGRQLLHLAQVDCQVGIGLTPAGGGISGLVTGGNGLPMAVMGGAAGGAAVIVRSGAVPGGRQHQQQRGREGVPMQ